MILIANNSASDVFHHELAQFNVSRLAAGMPSKHWEDGLQSEFEFRLDEGRYVEALRLEVAPLTLGHAGDGNHFVHWFEALADTGPGQQHPLLDALAQQATLAQMRWFLSQETAGEASFEDLLAYTQVKLPAQAKLACARHFWSDMGHGKQSAMHAQMLGAMVQELDLKPSLDATVWQALALKNTMVALATTRRYTYHAIGALGMTELTAPRRAAKISQGMRHLGLNGRMRAYFDLQAAQDVAHMRCWMREIIRPLIDANPQCVQYIAEGALMRLLCEKRCFDRYAEELGVDIADMQRSWAAGSW